MDNELAEDTKRRFRAMLRTNLERDTSLPPGSLKARAIEFDRATFRLVVRDARRVLGDKEVDEALAWRERNGWTI